MKVDRVAIIGTVGIPANYGGFETLVENLVKFPCAPPSTITVYCSSKAYENKVPSYNGARLVYLPFSANGISSVLYDAVSLFHAAITGHTKILVLGVSGAAFIPLVRALFRAEVITNIDGIEWKRDKWSTLAKSFLKYSEKVAVKHSNKVITDNQGISDHVLESYGKLSTAIAYGGDNALSSEALSRPDLVPEGRFALSLCRIEPENNVHLTLEAAVACKDLKFVIIGNWNNSEYGRQLRHRFGQKANIVLHDPIYDVRILRFIRESSSAYIHGHSAGGTNPSLVEAMHFGKPIFAFDCNFNRYTTEDAAIYYKDSIDLANKIIAESPHMGQPSKSGNTLQVIAKRKFTWSQISKSYWETIFESARKQIDQSSD